MSYFLSSLSPGLLALHGLLYFQLYFIKLTNVDLVKGRKSAHMMLTPCVFVYVQHVSVFCLSVCCSLCWMSDGQTLRRTFNIILKALR